jgi:hypothetical protein
VEAVRRFRRFTVLGALALTLGLAVLAYPWSPPVAKGLVLGGTAGIVTFWMLARRFELLATTRPDALQSATFRWGIARMAVYAVALGVAFPLDPDHHAFIAAALGLFIVRVVAVFLGVTGLDQPPEAG